MSIEQWISSKMKAVIHRFKTIKYRGCSMHIYNMPINLEHIACTSVFLAGKLRQAQLQ